MASGTSYWCLLRVKSSVILSGLFLTGAILGILTLIHTYEHSPALASLSKLSKTWNSSLIFQEQKVNQKEKPPTEQPKDSYIPIEAVLPKSPVDDHEDGVGVVNPHPFNVILSNPNICRVKDLLMLVYVMTAADNFRRRAVIRQTWGDVKRFPNVRIMFVMGKTTSLNAMQDVLNMEMMTYGDILEEDLEDTYHNLTHKGIAALKFISKYCNNAPYVVKTDDDVFINMYSLRNHLMQLQRAGYKKNLILCKLASNRVQRHGKWGIPKEVFSDDVYPRYCMGIAYLFSNDVVSQLYNASFYEKFFWVEDVYVSGLLAKHVNATHTSMGKAYCDKSEIEAVFTHPTEWSKYVFTHLGTRISNETLFLNVWEQVSKYAGNETIPAPTKISPGVLADFYESKSEIMSMYKKKNIGKIENTKIERKEDKQMTEKYDGSETKDEKKDGR